MKKSKTLLEVEHVEAVIDVAAVVVHEDDDGVEDK